MGYWKKQVWMEAAGMCEKSELQTILKKVTSASVQLYGKRLNKIMVPMHVGIIRMNLI